MPQDAMLATDCQRYADIPAGVEWLLGVPTFRRKGAAVNP